MSFTTFKKAIELNEAVAIGGGEPTLHPRFWDFLMYAVGHCDYVWLATNGSIKETSLTLASLTKKGSIDCSLSLDGAHDRSMVSSEVIEAFKNIPHGIRDIFHDYKGNLQGPLAVGRAIENYQHFLRNKEAECICPGPLIEPDGKILWCGCPGAPVIGSVYDKSFQYPEKYFDFNNCYTDYIDE